MVLLRLQQAARRWSSRRLASASDLVPSYGVFELSLGYKSISENPFFDASMKVEFHSPEVASTVSKDFILGGRSGRYASDRIVAGDGPTPIPSELARAAKVQEPDHLNAQ